MALPTLKHNSKARRRYAIYYYVSVGDFTHQDTSGSTDRLENAFANAAGHLARSELNPGEYAQALVIDRQKGRILRKYVRVHGGTITAKDLL